MAYGTETHDANMISYVTQITHTVSGAKATINFVVLPDSTGVYPPEAKRDSLFQGFLTQVAGMANVTVDSATKHGGYNTPVTP